MKRFATTPCLVGWAALLTALSLASSPKASAHHSPNDVIKTLTQRIADGENTAKILARRGSEYRAIGDHAAAVADYRSALLLDAEFTSALYGLARAYYDQSRWSDSQRIAERGITAAVNGDEAGPFHAIVARIHERNERWNPALLSWRRALASSRPSVDWFLGEARSLTTMTRFDDAREALERAKHRNASTVLRRAWLEALIRCGDTLEAEKQISAGLATSRWRSSWLLLRARLRLAQNQPDAAQQDARTALHEIDLRRSPDSVNPFLTADRGDALLLLGRNKEARACTELARSFGVSNAEWME